MCQKGTKIQVQALWMVSKCKKPLLINTWAQNIKKNAPTRFSIKPSTGCYGTNNICLLRCSGVEVKLEILQYCCHLKNVPHDDSDWPRSVELIQRRPRFLQLPALDPHCYYSVANVLGGLRREKGRQMRREEGSLQHYIYGFQFTPRTCALTVLYSQMGSLLISESLQWNTSVGRISLCALKVLECIFIA